LPALIIVLTISALIVVPWVTFVANSTKTNTNAVGREEEFYAADAGLQAVIKDLIQGADPLGVYTPPSITVNGYSPTISITSTSSSRRVPFSTILADPESTGGLASLAASATFQYVIRNVETSTPMYINWNYAPAGSTRIRLYQGVGIGGTLVTGDTASTVPRFLNIDGLNIIGGTYTIEFANLSGVTIASTAFSYTGSASSTWIRTVAYRDYKITSTVGQAKVVATVRQAPGSNSSTRSVHIISQLEN
jgi:hypothetical protein